MSKPKVKRRIFKVVLTCVALALVLPGIALGIVYVKKDQLIQNAIDDYNETINGQVSLEEVRISPFENFPYISIDLYHLALVADKSSGADTLLKMDDAYVGFDVLSIINGKYEVKKIKVSNGQVNVTQEYDGSFNINNAIASSEPSQELMAPDSSSLLLSLEAIEFQNIDILKLNRETNLLVELFIEKGLSRFNSTAEEIEAELSTQGIFNIVIDGDTSFFHDKHLNISTGIQYDTENEFLTISPSTLQVENASFLAEGSIDILNNLFVDVTFSGQKPDFDLFLAFAPPELNPVLSRYENGGQVYFYADVYGPVALGQLPHVDIDFGCEEAFVENRNVQKGLDELFFKGHFTNGDLNESSTTSLVIEDIRAKPETGVFNGAISVTNFESPDIEMAVDSKFNLDFLIDFFQLENIKDAQGEISLKMNFHDIIDLDDPTKAIERFNESYYTELEVKDLSFSSPDFHLPISNLNISASMDGHRAIVSNFSLNIGGSDIQLDAAISDLPAVIHHTDIPVDVSLNISSDQIDMLELTRTKDDTLGFDEQIKDLSLGFAFKSSARAFTESPNLPIGEFFINQLNAQLTHYPHALHDFNADILIDTTDFKIIDFTGFLDASDFHFFGRLHNYDLWFEEEPVGKTEIDFDLTANQLKLQDLFAYGGENYVPEDYRQEEFDDLTISGTTQLLFNKELTATSLQIKKIKAYMPVHQMRFEEFKGHFELDSIKVVAKNVSGRIGNSTLAADMTYYLDTETNDRTHYLKLTSPLLDFDQLFAYMPEELPDSVNVDHDAAFNIFDLPFSNLNLAMDITHMKYHKYLLDDFKLEARMQENHFIYVDTMSLEAAGGKMQLKGYFNGSDPEQIYLSPNMQLENVDLDKLLFKFDNFGQDQLVSNNLHGQLSGSVTGKIRMHPDLIPIINDSNLDIDVEVTNGSLVDFTPFQALSDFFTDKNLSMVRFDTLRNTLSLTNGNLIIPKMNLNTSLGYFEISGRQGVDLDMAYEMRIPVKVVAKAGFQRLFAKKNRDNTGNVDEIEYRDFTRNTRFVNVLISGTPDDYEVKVGTRKRE